MLFVLQHINSSFLSWDEPFSGPEEAEQRVHGFCDQWGVPRLPWVCASAFHSASVHVCLCHSAPHCHPAAQPLSLSLCACVPLSSTQPLCMCGSATQSLCMCASATQSLCMCASATQPLCLCASATQSLCLCASATQPLPPSRSASITQPLPLSLCLPERKDLY